MSAFDQRPVCPHRHKTTDLHHVPLLSSSSHVEFEVGWCYDCDTPLFAYQIWRAGVPEGWQLYGKG